MPTTFPPGQPLRAGSQSTMDVAHALQTLCDHYLSHVRVVRVFDYGSRVELLIGGNVTYMQVNRLLAFIAAGDL